MFTSRFLNERPIEKINVTISKTARFTKYYQKVVIYLNVLINQKQNITFGSVDK